MNKELKQLVEYAIADGHITDKEKKTLIKKGEKLGYDAVEIEMVLEGRLGELRQDRLEDSPLKKCPSCGEILNGISKVCPACDYVVNDEEDNVEGYDDLRRQLESRITQLKRYPKTGGGHIGTVMYWIVFTAGIHLVYRAIKGGPLFAKEPENYTDIIEEIDETTTEIETYYGTNPDVKKALLKYKAEKEALIQQRRGHALRQGLVWSGILAAIVLAAIFWPKGPDTGPDADELVEQYIKEGKIAKAKAALPGVDNESQKANFEIRLREMEIDSLVAAKNYNAALEMVNTENDSYERERLIDNIITTEVDLLIKEKNFSKARERSALASYSEQSQLERKIELAEKINK